MTYCRHCKAEIDAAHVDRVVYNKTPLYGPWEGWRMAGRDLIAPDRQRISPERLRGLLFREANRKALDRAVQIRRSPASQSVVSLSSWLPPRERFAGYA